MEGGYAFESAFGCRELVDTDGIRLYERVVRCSLRHVVSVSCSQWNTACGSVQGHRHRQIDMKNHNVVRFQQELIRFNLEFEVEAEIGNLNCCHWQLLNLNLKNGKFKFMLKSRH